MAQLAKCLTLDFSSDHDLRVVRLSVPDEKELTLDIYICYVGFYYLLFF